MQALSDSDPITVNLFFKPSSFSINQPPQIHSLKAWKSLSKGNRGTREKEQEQSME